MNALERLLGTGNPHTRTHTRTHTLASEPLVCHCVCALMHRCTAAICWQFVVRNVIVNQSNRALLQQALRMFVVIGVFFPFYLPLLHLVTCCAWRAASNRNLRNQFSADNKNKQTISALKLRKVQYTELLRSRSRRKNMRFNEIDEEYTQITKSSRFHSSIQYSTNVALFCDKQSQKLLL